MSYLPWFRQGLLFFLKKFLFAKSIIARQFMIGSAMKVIPKSVGSLLGVLKNYM